MNLFEVDCLVTRGRSLIGVLVMVLSAAAVAGDTDGARTRSAPPATNSPTDEVSRQAATANQVASLLTPAGVAVVQGLRARETGTFRQVQVHWETPGLETSAAGARQAPGVLTGRRAAPGFGSLPRRRALELAETEVLIAAVDGQSRLLWWHVMTDPRLLRAESVAESGALSGGVSYLPRVDFPIAYPDDAAIEELRLYHPEWTGAEFRLTPLAVLSVR